MTEQLDWSEIGSRLRQARMAAGLSQEQLGRIVGLERTMVVKAESGSRRLDALELSRIAAALGLPLAHFSPCPSTTGAMVTRLMATPFSPAKAGCFA